MFQGTGKKAFDCRRCKVKDTRRKFLNGGEDFERVEFGELDLNSRGSSPHGYGNTENKISKDKVGTQQENKSPQQSPMFRDKSMKTIYECQRCLGHHQAYSEKMEYPREQPLFFDRGEYRTRPRKTRQASPTGKIWTPHSLRGLDSHSPSPRKGGHNVLSPSQQLEEKEKEENLSLRFSHMPMTDCAYYLHYHGYDYEHDPQPGHGRSLFGSMANLEATELQHHGDDWWKNSEEEHSCKKCLSHHKKNEKSEKRRRREDHNLRVVAILDSMRERKASRKKTMALGESSTEFTTPREEFSRSRTPTPQRSYNYRDLYERKIQARGSPGKSHHYELRQMWKPLGKTPKYDIEEYLSPCKMRKMERNYDNGREGASTPWTQHKLNERRKASLGRLSQHHKYHTAKNAQMMKNVERGSYSARSPKWSRECLHKRELISRTHRRATGMARAQEKRVEKERINYIRQNILIGRTQRPSGHEKMCATRELSPKFDKGRVYKSQALPVTPNVEKEYKKIIKSRLQYEDEGRAKMLEERESRWAPPPNWTTRQLNVKEIRQRGASPKKSFKIDGDLLPTKVQDMKENLNLNTCMSFGEASSTNIASKSPKPSKMHPNEISSAGKTRQPCLPHQDKNNIDYRFEVINMKNKEFEERNPDSSRPNSSPNHKQIYLRIPKSRYTTKNDNDQKAAAQGATSQMKEKSPLSKHKGDKDIKLTVEMRSELPLDAVDGRLKEFLKGVGGLIYHSPKDGGIPRIKELTNYFSGKQPLLWFFPRST